MPTLAQELDDLLDRVRDADRPTIDRIEILNSTLFANDAEIMRRLEDVLTQQASRAVDMVEMLSEIAARVGHVPQREFLAHYGQTPTRPIQPPPLPDWAGERVQHHAPRSPEEIARQLTGQIFDEIESYSQRAN